MIWFMGLPDGADITNFWRNWYKNIVKPAMEGIKEDGCIFVYPMPSDLILTTKGMPFTEMIRNDDFWVEDATDEYYRRNPLVGTMYP